MSANDGTNDVPRGGATLWSIVNRDYFAVQVLIASAA